MSKLIRISLRKSASVARRLKRNDLKHWRKFGFEFLSIFIAVVSAFALNNWNENRKANESEAKILIEIANGLEKDLEDFQQNKLGHKHGVNACHFFKDALAGQKVEQDSLMFYYNSLTRDYISIQNTAGYETLKSRGLELIENDALRLEVISLYEYDYEILRKLEEEYAEMQFQKGYFKEINEGFAPHFEFDDEGKISRMEWPLNMPAENKKLLLTYISKIERNRKYIITYYTEIEEKVSKVHKDIDSEIEIKG
ncbi:MAG: DUF6090 family protein [Salinimicrobium sp.]